MDHLVQVLLHVTVYVRIYLYCCVGIRDIIHLWYIEKFRNSITIYCSCQIPPNWFLSCQQFTKTIDFCLNWMTFFSSFYSWYRHGWPLGWALYINGPSICHLYNQVNQLRLNCRVGSFFLLARGSSSLVPSPTHRTAPTVKSLAFLDPFPWRRRWSSRRIPNKKTQLINSSCYI